MQIKNQASSKWYSIRAAAASRAATVFIYGDIGESWFGETVTAAQFSKDLQALDVDALTVRINSYGGSVVDGIAIYNAIKRHPAQVVVEIDGVAASVASLIAMSGDIVRMAENAMLMVHAPWGGAIGNSEVMREYADLLDMWADAMAGTYAKKTGRDKAEMLALLTDGKDHHYSAEQALAEKFVDEITGAQQIAASANYARQAEARFHATPTQILARPESHGIIKAISDKARKLLSWPRAGDGPMFPVGARVQVASEPHMEGQGAGEVREAVLTYAYGVAFDGADDEIHHWYIESELEAADEAAEAPDEEPAMPDTAMTAAARAASHSTLPREGYTMTEDQIRDKALAADNTRRNAIKTAFAKFIHHDGVTALMEACAEDHQCSAAQASEKLLAHLGANASPAAGHHVVMGEDERDKFIGAAVEAIMARSAARDDKGPVRVSAGNPYRGHKLLDIARACLQRRNVKTDGMSQMDIVAAAFTQSTSDFPVLLESVMHKTLQQAYAMAPDTWSRFCAVGSVSDFRAHPRYRVGSLGNLDTLTELMEFKNKTIPDGEKASVTAGTKGNVINLSRQTIVNDDLGAFVGLSNMLGRAAKRTIEADVYALLASNPVMGDGVALFHANHGNLAATGTAVSVTSIDAGRAAMASQKDVSGNDYLDLHPALWLGPTGIGGTARVTNDSQYDPDANNKLQRPNMVRGLFRDVIDTPRLTGTAWHMFADPNEAPVIEVAFLDGVQEPFLELQNGFDVDGARYKVRLDFGVAAIDYRGAYKNPGA